MRVYEGFTTWEELVKDHKGLKEQIKDREKRLDDLQLSDDIDEIKYAIDRISNEMMAVNM